MKAIKIRQEKINTLQTGRSNIVAWFLLGIMAVFTIFAHAFIRIAVMHSSFLNSIDKTKMVFFFYLFMLAITLLFSAILILKNKSYFDILGLAFPWKQFKPLWFIAICLLWILPNVLAPKWVFPPFSLFLVIGVFIAPVIEEFIFRGFILGLLSNIPIWKWAKLDLGVIIMSLFFALWHFDITNLATIMLIPFLLHFLGGLTLGMLRNQTGAIWLGVIAHALGNLVSMLHGIR